MIYKFLFLLMIVFSTTTFAQDKKDTLQCPYGLLEVIKSDDYNKHSDLLDFNGKEIYRNNETGYSINFLEKFFTKNKEFIIVISLSKASDTYYMIVSIMNENDEWMSEIFGNGSKEIEINIYDGGKLTILCEKTADRFREIFAYKNRIFF